MATQSPRPLEDDILHVKSANFSYAFSDVAFFYCGPGPVFLYYFTAKISEDYERIKRLSDRFEIIHMSHTSFEWHEEMAILARKADEWLVELEKLEANMSQAWLSAKAKRYGTQSIRIVEGSVMSPLTENANRYAAGEDWCSWYVESPDGNILESSDDSNQEVSS